MKFKNLKHSDITPTLQIGRYSLERKIVVSTGNQQISRVLISNMIMFFKTAHVSLLSYKI